MHSNISIHYETCIFKIRLHTEGRRSTNDNRKGMRKAKREICYDGKEKWLLKIDSYENLETSCIIHKNILLYKTFPPALNKILKSIIK